MAAPAPWQPPSEFLLRWFITYSRRYLRRGFHSLRLLRPAPPELPREEPLVVITNHAAWWDPLTMLVLTREFFPGRVFAGPIEAAALERYGIFRRLGFFGVEPGTLRGARQFLRGSETALAHPGGALLVTAQGRFADVRERPPRFQPGVGQLAAWLERGTFVPLAVEYAFWEERLPEALAHFGDPIRVGTARDASAAEWTQRLEAGLVAAQDALARASMRREAASFAPVLAGRTGIGGVYDGWRRLRAWSRGEQFRAQHSDL